MAMLVEYEISPTLMKIIPQIRQFNALLSTSFALYNRIIYAEFRKIRKFAE